MERFYRFLMLNPLLMGILGLLCRLHRCCRLWLRLNGVGTAMGHRLVLGLLHRFEVSGIAL